MIRINIIRNCGSHNFSEMLIRNFTMEVITSTKKALRKQMTDIIKQIKNEEKVRQSKKVYHKLINLPEYQNSKRISLYLSTDDEISTLPILQHIFNSNREVFIPQYHGKNMKMVKLESMEDYHSLPSTKWNIKQPAIDDHNRIDALKTGGLDMIIIPGVAFTRTGKRLGHGMGYYDRFLESCLSTQTHRPHIIALALNEQIRDDLPVTEKDVHMDSVLTENTIEG